MEVIVLHEDDMAVCQGGRITFYTKAGVFGYAVRDVDKLSIFTTSQGPFADDMALAVFFMDMVFVILSEHPCFPSFLFDGIAEAIEIDFEKVIRASVCTEDAEFVVYLKQ